MQDLQLPSSRMWVLVAIISITLIVTFGIGLALGGLGNGYTEQPAKSPLYIEPSTSREGHYNHAAVACDSLMGSKMGSIVMQLHRGSAVDAAIITILAAGVTDPHVAGIGGGHFITYYKKATKEVHTVIGREQAPLGVTMDMFTEANTSKIGGKSIGVPGEVLGLYEAWKLGGSENLAWKDLFGPAIRLSTVGFLVGPAFLDAIDHVKEMHPDYFEDSVPAFKEFITNPTTGEIYKKGDTMKRPQLAKTLQIIAEEGPYAFYNGSLAENITLDINDAGGIITLEDLASYTAPVKPANIFRLNDNNTVYSPPLPSGGVLYQYILNILKGYNMDNTSVSTADKALKTYHRITEAFKHAFARRSELGDTDVGTNAIKTAVHQLVMNMTDPVFGELTRALISDTTTYDHAHYNQKYANAWDMGGSQYSVVGPNGDAVAVSSTVNSYFGSKVIGSRTGILFNNQMYAFSRDNSKAKAYPANSIAPGRRPLSSMSPSIVLDGHGDVKLVVGASGGPKMITTTALTTMETLWFDWTIKEAIDYPRFHHQMVPKGLQVELGFPQVLIDGLRNMGHNTIVYHPDSSSQLQGIQRTASTQLSACSDSRGYGEAQGFG